MADRRCQNCDEMESRHAFPDSACPVDQPTTFYPAPPTSGETPQCTCPFINARECPVHCPKSQPAPPSALILGSYEAGAEPDWALLLDAVDGSPIGRADRDRLIRQLQSVRDRFTRPLMPTEALVERLRKVSDSISYALSLGALFNPEQFNAGDAYLAWRNDLDAIIKDLSALATPAPGADPGIQKQIMLLVNRLVLAAHTHCGDQIIDGIEDKIRALVYQLPAGPDEALIAEMRSYALSQRISPRSEPPIADVVTQWADRLARQERQP